MYDAPSAPAAKPTFVRKAAFWRIPVTAAPASAEVTNERSGTGFCCEPKVPGLAPDGSTLLVRQRIATGQFDWNLKAPAEPTGRLRSDVEDVDDVANLPGG